jgi:7-carboxy-7-deazaguanine synthase
VKLPILETFHSIQGEGTNTGYPTYFIRLAGCNLYHNGNCQSWTNETFKCDTKIKQKVFLRPIEDLISNLKTESYVCITGGEPFLRTNHAALEALVTLLLQREKIVTFETNGTLTIPDFFFEYCYIACSPKKGYLPEQIFRMDEVRLLIKDPLDLTEIDPVFLNHHNVFLSPVNYANKAWGENTQHTLQVLANHPNWRLSIQVHKYIGVR